MYSPRMQRLQAFCSPRGSYVPATEDSARAALPRIEKALADACDAAQRNPSREGADLITDLCSLMERGGAQ